jgi:hypothetical protein
MYIFLFFNIFKYLYDFTWRYKKQCKYITIENFWFLLEEIQKNRKISIQGWRDLSFCGELSFTLSLLFLSASITAPTCKAIIISLEPCALNADFQHFIPRSNKFPYFMDTPERRIWGERRPKDRVTLQIIFVFTLKCFGLCKVYVTNICTGLV